MINLQKLRHLSCICAYCGKVMPMNERTNDHMIPRCAGGTTETHNIVRQLYTFLHKVRLKSCHSEALPKNRKYYRRYFAPAQYDSNLVIFV